MFARFIDAGRVLEYTPEALVWHHHRDDMAALERQFRGYGESVGALHLKAVLDRKGFRRRAVQHFWQWVRIRLAIDRAIQHDSHLLPRRLLYIDLVGGFTGLLRYAAARRSAQTG